ncbi:MAG: histidine phosphatase family protein [Deltaproteobacteria bacterium]|nr:histidine phosphatase family protein [Deltaproteobacteria bacterium]
MASKVLLIRHGETDTKYRGCFIGSTDIPLSPEGRLQSSLLAGPLRREAAVRYISSPSLRTCETAQCALAWNPIAPDLDPDIREVDFGAWEGKTFEEITASDPEAVAGWASYRPDFAFPGGEAIADFTKRVQKAGERIAADPAETVVVFTHAGITRAMICHYLGLDARNYLYFDVKPASVTTIMVHNGRGVLTGLNDLCHLEDRQHG